MKNNYRDALLNAEMHELRGEGDSEIARRIRSDQTLHAEATRLLDGLESVNATIVSAAASRSAVAASRTFASKSISSHATSSSPRMRWSLGALITSGALAAAVVATIMVSRPTPVKRPAATEDRPLTATLNATSSRPFAVIPTDNPDIAVVWLFPKETK